jgi:hypothetical protein
MPYPSHFRPIQAQVPGSISQLPEMRGNDMTRLSAPPPWRHSALPAAVVCPLVPVDHCRRVPLRRFNHIRASRVAPSASELSLAFATAAFPYHIHHSRSTPLARKYRFDLPIDRQVISNLTIKSTMCPLRCPLLFSIFFIIILDGYRQTKPIVY